MSSGNRLRASKNGTAVLVTGLILFGALCAAILVAMPASGHPRHSNAMVRGQYQVGDSGEKSHLVYGGYGYIAESEAEAYEALSFGCEREDQEQYYSACSPATSVPAGENLVSDAMRVVVLQDLRRHESEFLLMQGHVLGAQGDAPACVTPDAELENLQSNLPAVLPTGQEILATPAGPARDRLNRHRVSATPLASGEMIRALIFHDQMQHQWTQWCTDTSDSFCTDIANQRRRIETSFPALFGSGTVAARNQLRTAVQELLGARFPEAGTRRERAARGRTRYQALRNADETDALKDFEKAISDALRDGRDPPANQAEGVTNGLRAGTTRVNSAIRAIREAYATTVSNALGQVCSRDSIDDYLSSSPNLVRQMLVDANPQRRAMARLVLCQSPRIRDFRRERACEGVSGISNTGGVLDTRVRRTDWSYPYVSHLNYTVDEPRRPPSDAPSVVRTTMAVRVSRNLDSDEADVMIGRMQEQSNAWYNCMTGQRSSLAGVSGLPAGASCPANAAMRTPPVKFEISIVRTPPAPETPPVVSLHDCYNAELTGPAQTNCELVRQHAINQCRDSIQMWQRQGRVGGSARYAPDMEEFLENIALPPRPVPRVSDQGDPEGEPDYLNMTEEQMTNHCTTVNPPADDGRYNREDSSNYTRHTVPGTVLHEVGHAMGLPDEYQDPTYPFLPQGEHDSLMNDSSNPASVIRPRHLERILEPRNCLRTRRARAAVGNS